jgi:hypothetical protein
MVLLQSCATVAAVQSRRWPAIIGSAVLGLSAGLSGISGFFDGQLARSDLGAAYVTAQVGYVVMAWLAVASTVNRLWAIRGVTRRRHGRTSEANVHVP